MENEIKDVFKVSFECNISGITKQVDILIDYPGYPPTVADIESIVKQIKQSLKLKSPRIESLKIKEVPAEKSWYMYDENYEEEDDNPDNEFYYPNRDNN